MVSPPPSPNSHSYSSPVPLGLVFSYFAYRQYYPTLESPFSHKPYSPRIAREDGYRESVLPFATVAAQEDYDYSYNGGAAGFRRAPSAYSAGGRTAYSTAGAGYSSQTNAYPPPMPRMRSDNKYDDEESAVGVGGGAAVQGGAGARLEETSPRPSGEPLVEMHGREREDRA